MPETNLIPRATVEEIVGHRDRAIRLYVEAHAALARADQAVREAQVATAEATLGFGKSFHAPSISEVERFRNVIKLVDEDEYLRTARKIVDGSVWASIIERTDLERLMDAQSKEELRGQMEYQPERSERAIARQVATGEEPRKGMPPLTVENVYATLQTFAAEADTIFVRGIANAFSRLDDRFRSHDAFKLGSRIILTHAFDDWGHWRSWSAGGTRDVLMDVERAFAVLDGQKVGPTYATMIGVIDRERQAAAKRPGEGLYSEHMTPFFKVRCYKNGNIHLWFTRKDLVAKVNRLLAQWYGEVLGDASEGEEDPLARMKLTPAKFFGFYPTPRALVDRIVKGHARGFHDHDLRILEPSAGNGAIARQAAQAIELEHFDRESGKRLTYYSRALVDCIEIQPDLAQGLLDENLYNRVWCGDFLEMQPGTTGLYDRIFMNPPFDLERDVDHVVHALRFLHPKRGTLVSIMSAGTFYRSTKKSQAFQALIARMKGGWIHLPVGSFREQGTNVNTILLKVHADGTKVDHWSFN